MARLPSLLAALHVAAVACASMHSPSTSDMKRAFDIDMAHLEPKRFASAGHVYNRTTGVSQVPLAVVGFVEESKYMRGGLCDSDVQQRSGYFKINETGKTNEHYFYWMFEARKNPAKAPFVLWLTGGPGCSGMLALLNENGPCSIERTESGLQEVTNPYSWTNHANVLWIDQPTGVGFSYGDSGDFDHDEKGVRDDMYHFLVEFFTAHPEYRDLPLFVFGESYGGHYAPNVAYRVMQGNQRGESPFKINLQGLAVGNGLTDPAVQYKYYPAMAYHNGYGVKSVDAETYAEMLSSLPSCIAQIDGCQTDDSKCAFAQDVCNNALIGPYERSGLNPYDVRIKCKVPGLCYDFSAPTEWLNLPTTRTALGISSKSSKWSSCNMRVNSQFSGDWMKAQQYTVPPLLASGVRVLIYAGDADFICNWMGNKAWVKALEWPGQSAFNATKDRDWIVGGLKAGTARSAANLTFLQVNKAGHMVPMDQPASALAMLDTFLTNGKF